MYLPLDVCIYIMYIYQMQAVYNTCCFPSPSATQPSPTPPFLSPPGRPQADGSPLMCRGFFKLPLYWHPRGPSSIWKTQRPGLLTLLVCLKLVMLLVKEPGIEK